MVNRDYYLQRIIRSMWNGEIKVITGIRRCGKSVLLFDLFYQHLHTNGVPEDRIIKIELDQRRFYQFRNPITLCNYVENIVTQNNNEQFYLFIDEVQFTQKVNDTANGNIEITIYDMLNELKAYKNLDVYVTGSNSKGLSKDIATEFRGRATQIHIYPLSFKEFYSGFGGDVRDALDTYMLYGGMPRLLTIENERDKCEHLTSDMYPQNWTPSNGGIVMKYDYEFKKKCVKMYREGKWADTPDEISEGEFHKIIRQWFRIEESSGPEALKHKEQNKAWTAEEKYELVAQVIAGNSSKGNRYFSRN